MPGPTATLRRLCGGSAGLAVCVAWLAVVPWADAAWRWPLHGEVRRAFLVRPSEPYGAGQHRGIDVAAPPGATVRAACPGRVHFSGRIGRSGGVVSVRCGALLATYLHLGRVQVRRGAQVRAGGRLGAVGAAAHLHLGARDARTGRYVDPLSLLRAPGGPSLGPAPVRRRPARPSVQLPAPRPVPAVRPVAAPEPGAVPAIAWAGLALVAAGLPLGGLVAIRHRSRQRTAWTSTKHLHGAAYSRGDGRG
jgi:hypothetical protein